MLWKRLRASTRRLVQALTAGLLGCSAALAAPETGPAHVLRMAFPIAETSLDPAQINDEYSSEIVSNIFESPLVYDYLARPAGRAR